MSRRSRRSPPVPGRLHPVRASRMPQSLYWARVVQHLLPVHDVHVAVALGTGASDGKVEPPPGSRRADTTSRRPAASGRGGGPAEPGRPSPSGSARPSQDPSEGAGRDLEAACSWQKIHLLHGGAACPPNFSGQVIPAQRPSQRVRCHSRQAATCTAWPSSSVTWVRRAPPDAAVGRPARRGPGARPGPRRGTSASSGVSSKSIGVLASCLVSCPPPCPPFPPLSPVPPPGRQSRRARTQPFSAMTVGISASVKSWRRRSSAKARLGQALGVGPVGPKQQVRETERLLHRAQVILVERRHPHVRSK